MNDQDEFVYKKKRWLRWTLFVRCLCFCSVLVLEVLPGRFVWPKEVVVITGVFVAVGVSVGLTIATAYKYGLSAVKSGRFSLFHWER